MAREHPLTLPKVLRARVKPGTLALWHIGGAGYVLRSRGACILIDPFTGPSPSREWVRRLPPAISLDDLRGLDAVLLTHEHVDHTDPFSLEPIARNSDAAMFGPSSSIHALDTIDVPPAAGRLIEWGESVEIADLSITAVEMYDPGATSCNGYLIETDGVALLHCGDGLYFPGFAELGDRRPLDAICLSVGANPPGTTYYMDEADAARAARDARAGILIPQHFDLWEATALDPRRVVTVARWYCPEVQVIPARLCQRITVGTP